MMSLASLLQTHCLSSATLIWFSLHIASAFNFTPPETINVITFITRDTILMDQHMWLDTADFTTVKFHVLPSHVEIQDYSTAYFDCIATFEVLYH